jgi:hypothetical protein
MNRWEYNQVTLMIRDGDCLDRVTDVYKKLKDEKVVKDVKFIEYLNRLGSEGWELVFSEKSVLPKIGTNQVVYNMFFKRIKTK